jgi:hypothetical protein
MGLFDKQLPPYRMPCDQTASAMPQVFFGTKFQHANKSDTASVVVNTTLVQHPTSSTHNIPPYERWTIDETGGLTCQTHHCTSSAPCTPWEKPIVDNTFSASHDASGSQVTESFSVCHKTGFKNVQGRKLWQGYRPFNDLESTGAPDNVVGCGTVNATNVSYRSYQSAPSRTKYRTISISSDWTFTNNDAPSSNRSEAVAVTQTINSGSGLWDFSGFSSTGGNQHAIGNVGIALQGFSSIIGAMCTGVVPAFAGSTRTWSGGTIDLTHDTFGYSIDKEVYDIGAGTFTRDLNDRDSGGNVLNTLHEEYSVSATSLSYTSTVTFWDSGTPSSTIGQTTVVNVTATLSDAYTDSDVYSEIKDMLNHWDLTDDKQYPWRTDSKASIAPLVGRDEQANNNFTTNFSVADYGNPVANQDGTTMPDPFWIGNCTLALSQDPSTGTTTLAFDFPSVSMGDTFDGAVGNPFGYAISNSGSLTYSVVGGSFPSGVSFDTSTGHYNGTASDFGHWGITIEVSCGVPAFTGDLMGAPKPAGYQNYFNFTYVDMAGCCDRDDVGDVTWDLYQVGWGMNVETFNSLAGTQLPLNATFWNNFAESANKPDGAWLFFADPRQDYFPAGCISSAGTAGSFDGLYLVGQKYAVILDDWNSQNYLRPARNDKFMYDETIGHVFILSGSCDSLGSITGSGEGSQWGLLDLTNQNPVPDGTDFSGIWGGASVDGFYNVSYTGGVLTLGTKIYDVPSDWSSASEDEAFCFGKLRYPDAPSLLGREIVTSLATSSHQTVLTWGNPQTCFGLLTGSNQETIDLYDVKMTLLTSSINVTRIDDSTFLTPISSSFLKDGHSYYVTIHGASGSWYMSDSTPKGDYIILEWLADLRSGREFGRISGSLFDCGGSQISYPTTNKGGGDVNLPYAQFNQTQSCLPVTPCSPKVVCASPNGEQFANGVTFPFPSDFVMDETYGAKWWKFPQTTMSDLLWQQPHRKACMKICAPWKNDNYGCNPDVVTPCPSDEDYTGEEPPPMYFFASAPQVEARIVVPSNYGPNQNESAPNVPSDVQIGWLSPVTTDPSTGSIAFPPAAIGVSQGGAIPNGAAMASALHAQICGAMGGGCRFAYSTAGCGTV